jgi:hypothetical protein
MLTDSRLGQRQKADYITAEAGINTLEILDNLKSNRMAQGPTTGRESVIIHVNSPHLD